MMSKIDNGNFEIMPYIDTTNTEQFDALLPWSTSLPTECKCPQKK